MTSQRVRDHLVGAGAAILVIALAVAGFIWSISAPAGSDDARPGPSVPSARPPSTMSAPPPDLVAGEMWFDDLVLESGTVATPESLLRDVTAVGHDVRSGPTGLVADWMTVDATVPFGLVAAELGEGVVISHAGGQQAMVELTTPYAGREFRVVATGTVEVERGLLVVEPTSIDVGGPRFLATLLARVVRELVTIEHEIEGLPEGLVLQEVTIEDDGFHASLEGTDVRIVF